jgi:hypothetical protein
VSRHANCGLGLGLGEGPAHHQRQEGEPAIPRAPSLTSPHPWHAISCTSCVPPINSAPSVVIFCFPFRGFLNSYCVDPIICTQNSKPHYRVTHRVTLCSHGYTLVRNRDVTEASRQERKRGQPGVAGAAAVSLDAPTRRSRRLKVDDTTSPTNASTASKKGKRSKSSKKKKRETPHLSCFVSACKSFSSLLML